MLTILTILQKFCNLVYYYYRCSSITIIMTTETTMMTIEDLICQAKQLGSLPVKQQRFINSQLKSLLDVLNYEGIQYIIHPTFTGHYWLIGIDSRGEAITTYHTDKSWGRWGNQSEEQEYNAYELSRMVIRYLCQFNPQPINTKRVAINIDGNLVRVKGLSRQAVKCANK